MTLVFIIVVSALSGIGLASSIGKKVSVSPRMRALK